MAAAEGVKRRLLRATAALDMAGVAYAVIGGNAVAVWVGQVDPAAIRLTADVDLLLRRADLELAKAAMTAAGFTYHETLGVHMFLEGPQASARDAIHVLMAGEKVREDYLVPAADVSESEPGKAFRVLRLDALVRMKLTSFRRKDQVHIQDMIGVGLIDASWVKRFPPELAARLQELLDDPNG
jgi:hypothetical protein